MDPNTPPADVTEVPANADTKGDSAEQTPGTADAGSDAKESFAGLFSQAKETALTGRDETAADDTEDKDAAADSDADEQIPAEEAADDDSEEAAADDQTTDKPAEGTKTPRSKAFKEVQAENVKLQGEISETNGRMTKLNEQFEQHGGVEVVELAMDLFNKVSAGDAAGIIDDLPPHAQAKVADVVLTRALANPNVRAQSVNSILKSDFGLEKDLSQGSLEKLFELATHRANNDLGDFEKDLDYQLSLIETPEAQLEKANREIERLKQPKTADEAQVPTDMELTLQANQKYDDLESATYSSVITPLLVSYGLDVKSSDSASVKAAKEILQRAVDDHVGVEIRRAKAFEPLLPYLLSGDPNYPKNPFYQQAEKAFGRAMKAKAETVVKSVSVLFGGMAAKAAPAKADPDQKDAGSTVPEPKVAALKVPASDGRTQVQPPKKIPARSGDFKSAFAEAKKRVGVG